MIILASASPRRRELLAALGVEFAVHPRDIDESPLPGEALESLVARLASAKAKTVEALFPSAVIIGADTLVSIDGIVLGKPDGAGEARAMLRRLCGRAHEVTTGVGVLWKGSMHSRVVTTRVMMRSYTDSEIEQSIASRTPFDKAGAYAIQDPSLSPVKDVDGCYCNVMGLPLWTLAEMLRRCDVPGPGSELRVRRPVCATCPLRLNCAVL